MSHGKAPGTHTRGGVNSTMGDANHVSTNKPANGMTGAFGAPRATGGGAIPTIVYADAMPKVAVPAPNAGQGTAPTYGGQGGQKRPGTK